ncbi:ABC transporter ATP-binding protein [Rhabdothermincola sediminis]|uniref:ABC transporter ATP-binding protein n=1 Tax=Rhabdothermincola sediminis TaxID=2751370 RepID=UPI003FD71F06
MPPHLAMGADPEAIKGATVGKDVVRRVLHLAKPYRWMLAGFVAVILGAALVALAPPLLFRQIIDSAVPEGNRGQLHLLAGLVVVAAVADAALAFAERWYSSRIGEGLIFDLRRALFDHVQRMPIAFFTRTQTGSLISRLNNDVIGAQRAMTATLGSVVSNVIVLATTLGAMFVLEWRLTVLALVLLPLFIVPAKRVGRRLQAITRESMNLNAAMNTQMTERFNVAGALLVKLFGNPDRESRDFAQRAGSVRDIGIKSAMYGRTFFIALGLVGAVGTAAVYWVGGQLVISGAVSLGTLVAMAAYVTRIYTPLTSLTNARVDIMTAFVSFDRVFEVLDAPNPIIDRPGAVDLIEPRGHIELDRVWFRYPTPAEVSVASLESEIGVALNAEPGEPVLRGITATIEPGQLVALVGPSGAGKTTLTSLIPRLYDVTSGAVRIDGRDVRDLTQVSLREAIGVVTQDPHLFHDSVVANLRYARPSATDAEIEAACRAAQIHDVIAALPDGYHTIVGERGYRLSGGEKQRLAIARMLLKDPAIVILDEATSHLDSENEALVQQALGAALAGRTSIVIAHRLSTIVAADQILVLDEGRLVERGTHTTLLAAGGLYADLYRVLVRSAVEAAGSDTADTSGAAAPA